MTFRKSTQCLEKFNSLFQIFDFVILHLTVISELIDFPTLFLQFFLQSFYLFILTPKLRLLLPRIFFQLG